MKQQRPDGWWYPWIFVGGFAVVIAVNAVMLVVATSTFSGLSVEKAFDKGNAYNAEIAAAQAQTRQGWQGTFMVDGSRIEADETRRVRWRLTMHDAQGLPVKNLQIMAQLERPTVRGYDYGFTMQANAAGIYTAETVLPLKGVWTVRVVASRPGEPPYRLRYRAQIP